MNRHDICHDLNIMLMHYLKISLRNLWKYKAQNLIGILGVSVGLVCFVYCLYIPRYALNIDTSYPGADRIYHLEAAYKLTIDNNEYNAVINQFTGTEKIAKERFPNDVEDVTSFYRSEGTKTVIIIDDDQKEMASELKLAETDTSFIRFFSLSLKEGSFDVTQQTPNSIVLFEEAAQKIGNPRYLIGKKMLCDNRYYQITGILKNAPITARLLRSQEGFIFNDPEGQLEKSKTEASSAELFIRLKKGVDQKVFSEKLSTLNYLLQNVRNESYFLITPLVKEVSKSELTTFSIMGLIGLLILLVSLFNYLSFFITRSYDRLGEVAIRKVNGSGKFQLFCLIFSEFLIAWLIIGLLCFFILDLFKMLKETISMIDPVDISVARIQLLEYLAEGIPLIALLCFFPVKTVNRMSIKMSLLGISEKGKKGIVRNAFLLIQMSVFLLFMSFSILIFQQQQKMYSNMLHTLSEEEKENIIGTTCYYPELSDKRDILLQRLKSSPAVQSVIYSYTPVVGHQPGIMNLGRTGFESTEGSIKAVPPSYLDFFKLQLISGEFYNEDSEPRIAVIDETFASLYKNENPIGKTFSSQWGVFKIVGIIEKTLSDVERKKNHPNGVPLFYTPFNYLKEVYNSESYCLYVKPYPGKQKEARQFLDQCIREFLPEATKFEICSLKESIRSSAFYLENQFQKVSVLISLISMAVCLLGLYSSIRMNVARRRKEMAIRKINGAGIWNIMLLFNQGYIFLLIGVSVIAFPFIYYWGNQWLDDFNQRIALNWVFFLTLFLLALILILLTIISSIWKAARENPAEVIKKE